MKTLEIKQQIKDLAEKHHAVQLPELYDELQAVEMIEAQALQLIVAYCEDRGYQIDGFPTAKRKLIEEEDLDEDEYFTQERYEWYICRLTLEKEDVAELYWFYQNSFWPDYHESQMDFIQHLKNQIESGFFQIEF